MCVVVDQPPIPAKDYFGVVEVSNYVGNKIRGRAANPGVANRLRSIFYLLKLISKNKFLQPWPRSPKIKTCMNLNLGAHAPGFYLGASVPYQLSLHPS